MASILRNHEKKYPPPLLKWTGGKRLLLKYIIPLFPSEFSTYYEPFVGGGAVFFALEPRNAVLADRNPELINCYRQVRDGPESVIETLNRWGASEAEYYLIRNSSPTEPVLRAARIVFLTRLSFNGIHRVNARGEFNVPFGHRPHLGSCDPGRIRSASRALQSARLWCSDFEQAVCDAGPDDVVYFDPPYTLPDDRTRFIRYNDRNFTWSDQIRLSQLATRLSDRGVRVIITNADHPEIRELYQAFRVVTVRRISSIAADGRQRVPTTECIFHNGT